MQLSSFFKGVFQNLNTLELLLLSLGVLLFIFFIFICIYIIPYFVYKDAKRREMNRFFWSLIHLIGFLSIIIPGFIIHIYYRIKRNPIGGPNESQESKEIDYHTFEHPNLETSESEKNESTAEVNLDEAFEEY